MPMAACLPAEDGQVAACEAIFGTHVSEQRLGRTIKHKELVVDLGSSSLSTSSLLQEHGA